MHVFMLPVLTSKFKIKPLLLSRDLQKGVFVDKHVHYRQSSLTKLLIRNWKKEPKI